MEGTTWTDRIETILNLSSLTREASTKLEAMLEDEEVKGSLKKSLQGASQVISNCQFHFDVALANARKNAKKAK